MSLTVLYPTLPNTADQARLDQVLDRALEIGRAHV